MKLLPILFFVCLANISYSQADYNFSRIFLDNGLSDSRVSSITQDKFGYMWFGTSNGLNRFDGYTIKTFYAKAEPNSLPSANILSLYSSKAGDLWVGTVAGLVKYSFAKENFSKSEDSSVLAKEVSKARINAITEDKKGNIYFGCNTGIIRFSPAGSKWDNLNQIGAPANIRRVSRLKFFSDNLLLATTSGNNPLFIYDLEKKKADSIVVSYGEWENPNLYGLEKINDSIIIAGSLSHGILKLNLHQKTTQFIPGILRQNPYILYNSVYDVLKDSRGRIWLASNYFRLAEYDTVNDSVIVFKKNIANNPYPFEGRNAISIFEDRQKNIWIGTGSNGVFYFNPDNNAVHFHGSSNYEKGIEESASVYNILMLDKDNLFAGTDKGFFIRNTSTGFYQNYLGKSTYNLTGPMEHTSVAIQDMDKNILWIGTNRLGLIRFDREKESFQNFSRVTKPSPLIDDGIRDLLQLSNGDIFLIGFGNPGIFNSVKKEYFSFRNDSINKFLQLNNLSSICKEEKGNVLVATNGGKLYRYEPNQNVLTDLSGSFETYKDLVTIYQVAQKAGTIYLVTNLGIISLNNSGETRLYQLTKDKNIEQEYRYILPTDDALWISSNRKIGKLDLTTGNIFFLGEKEGLKNIRFYPRSLTLSEKGTVLIGSVGGYYEIYPDQLRASATSQPPFLTGFRVNDVSLDTKEAVSGLKTLQLNYNENFFSFDLSNFSYGGAADIEYAYKLEGFDKDWQYLGRNRIGSYTNVPGGKYTLKLRARIAEGKWRDGQEVRIIIKEFFAYTWWFKLLAALLLVGLLYALYRYRIRHINKQALLRSDYEIKLNELENSALRTQMNPHFIFNSLNTINSFISLNETAQAHKYIASFSRLIRFILDHSRQKKILLENELEVLKLYIEIEQVRFSNKFTYEINVEKSIDPSTVEMPPLVIQPFVENAILHGLLPVENGGVLKINVKHAGDWLLISIEDNGIGRKRSATIRNQSFSLHKSHGIEITLKRISLFNKLHGKKAEVEITDLAQGTKVEIPLAWEDSF